MRASGNQKARRQCQLSSAHASYFQQVRKVFVAVSKVGYPNSFLLNLTLKSVLIKMLLIEELMPVIGSTAGNMFVSQQIALSRL